MSVAEWNTQTPEVAGDDSGFELWAFVEGGPVQSIDDITREEFIALKARLAEIRGLPFTDEEMEESKEEETSTAATPAVEPPLDRRTDGEPAWKFNTRVHKLLREYLADIDRYLLAHWRAELERDVDAPNQLAADITLLRNIAFAYHLADGLEFPGLKLLSAIEDHVEPQTMRPR